MKCLQVLATLILVPAFGSAIAEVRDSGPNGFTTVHEVIVAAPRAVVWAAAVDEVGLWWNAEHTVGGDASRLSIEARPLGCFCERLGADDGVVHLQVTTVSARTFLRMTGGLGPLGLLGVNGNFTWEFFDAGEGTRVRFTYAIGGYRDGGLEALAGPVDQVIGDALAHLRTHVETD
jgi:uncharacterized protein YndB with AHSA1/START domain